MVEVKINRQPSPPKSFDLLDIPPDVFKALSALMHRTAPIEVGLGGTNGASRWFHLCDLMKKACEEAGL